MTESKLPLILGVAGSLVALGLGFGLGKALPGHNTGSTPGTDATTAAAGSTSGQNHHSALGRSGPVLRAAVGEGLPASIAPEDKWGLRELVEFGMDADKMRWHGDTDRTPPLLKLAQHVNPADIPQLLDQLDESMPKHKAQNLQRLLMTLYARAAPAKAWDLAFSRKEKQPSYARAAYYVLNEWLRIAPYEALQATRALTEEGENHYYVRALSNLVEQDPMFVWRELEEFEGLSEYRKGWIRGEVIVALAKRDPAEANSLLDTVSDEQQRSRMLGKIAEFLCAKDPLDALNFIEEHGSSTYQKRRATLELLNHLVWRDVDAAIDLYSQLGTDFSDHDIGSRITEKLAESDPDRAWEYLQGLPLQSYHSAVEAFARKLDRDDPLPILEKLLSIPEESLRENALEAAFRIIGRENPEAALDLLRAHELEDDAGHALNQIFQSWGSHDGRKAARRVMEIAQNKEEFPKQLARQVVQGWAEVNPRKALEWALELPEDVQPNLVRNSINSWASHDLQGAGEWINTLGEGELRDQAVQGFLQQVHRVDNIAAMEWAGTISDENLRNRQLGYMGRNWKRIDQHAAREWIQSNDLPEKVKEQLLEEDD